LVFSPEDKKEGAVDNLLDFNGLSSVTSRPPQEVNASIEQLINLNYSTPTNTDDVNSNHVTSNSFIPTTGGSIKSQEQTITGFYYLIQILLNDSSFSLLFQIFSLNIYCEKVVSKRN
jgi:hypothetical protein